MAGVVKGKRKSVCRECGGTPCPTWCPTLAAEGRPAGCGLDHAAIDCPKRIDISGPADRPGTVFLHGDCTSAPEPAARARDTTPTHYQGGGGLQPWDVIEAFDLDFWQGNAAKYLLRAGRKGPAVDDYRKARHYLDYLIEREER